jgi:hypothetical protein
MLKSTLIPALTLAWALGCGGSTDSDGKGGSGGTAGEAGLACPTGECLDSMDDAGCVHPTGPQGNALCGTPSGVCSYCICASPDTPVATPSGDRKIADLQVGDSVYSLDQGRVRAVPIVATNRAAVTQHHVMRVKLASGVTLEISPGHPTADGQSFADLRAGDLLDSLAVLSAEIVPYRYSFTYDILPASDTGTYFAGGALIGSTLARRGPLVCSSSSPVSSPGF